MRKLIMSPGPTEISDDVLQAMCNQGTNPDLDPSFFDYYLKVSQKYSALVGANKGQSLILSGEAILGLEAACASFIQRGDKVLCLVNGVFGAGFVDFVKLYGGEPVIYQSGWDKGLNSEDIAAFLDNHTDITCATMVHCETPSGVTNPVADICRVLKDKGIISIVDSVSAVAGEHIDFDNDSMDVLLGGTQKCLSAAPGLTLVTLSARAIEALDKRTHIMGFYTNLAYFVRCIKEGRFPYTMPQQDIFGLEKAIDNAMAKDFVQMHRYFADIIRDIFKQNGFELYAKDCHANTLTAVKVPAGIDYDDLFNALLAEDIIIGGSLGDLKGKVFRIGHMGENNHKEKFDKLLAAMDKVFNALGKPVTLAQDFKQSTSK